MVHELQNWDQGQLEIHRRCHAMDHLRYLVTYVGRKHPELRKITLGLKNNNLQCTVVFITMAAYKKN